MQKALGERRWGPRLGTGPGRGVGTPRGPREVHSVHWYPPGGGGGPKKRHLVLYKLAGFCTADRRRRRAFFSLHSSPLGFENLSKSCKFRHFWGEKPPKNPILALFRPFFREFWREIPRGRGDPFFGGAPPGGGVPGVRAEPPLEGARRADGGVKKTTLR